MSEDADFNAYQEYGKDPDVARPKYAFTGLSYSRPYMG